MNIVLWLEFYYTYLHFFQLLLVTLIYFDIYITVQIDEKGCNLCLRLRARSRKIYVTQVSCSIFNPDKFEQTCAEITTENYFENDATAITITTVTHHIIINLWICQLFTMNIDVLKSLTTV